MRHVAGPLARRALDDGSSAGLTAARHGCQARRPMAAARRGPQSGPGLALEAMKTFRLAGVEVPRIGLGTNRLTTAPDHVSFVRQAVAAGVRHFDTAHLYTGGKSERALG